MAGRIAGITIKIGADSTKLQDSLKGVDKSLKQTQTALKDVNKLLKFNPGNTELLIQKQRNLKKAIGDTKTRLKELRKAAENATPESIGQEKYDALQREIIETENDLKNLEKEYKNFGSVGAQQIKAVGEKMQALGGKMQAAGKAMTMYVTAPLVGLGTAAVKTTADFDSSMSKVSAISGATGEDFTALRDKAREMGAQTQFSASEAADAMSYMAMAGWKTEDMLGGVEGIMNLAAASGEDLATTSDIVTDALTAFGMSAKDSGHFADVLAAASSNANTNVSLLGESFKYVAPVAGALGYSAEDTSLALGLMANAGIKASSAGTSLRTLLTNMSKPTKEMQEAMNQLGVSLTDDEGNMRSFREVMDQLRSGFGSLKDMTDEQRETLANLDQELADGVINEEDYVKQVEELVGATDDATGATKAQIAAMLSGKTGMSGLLAVVNASEEDYNKLADAIDNSSQQFAKLKDGSIVPMNEALESGQEIIATYNGEAEKMAAVMNDNLNGQLKVLLSQLQELAISIGDILMPYIQQFVSWLQQLVDRFNGLDDGTKKMIVTIAGIVAAVGPLLLVVGKVVSIVGTIMTYAPMIQAALVALTGPIGLVVAAIAAAIAIGVLLWKNWDTVKAKAIELKDSLLAEFNRIRQNISDAISNAIAKFNEMKAKVSNIMNMVKTDISNKITAAKNKVTSVVDAMKSGVTTKINAMKTAISSTFESIKSTVTNKINAAKNAVKNAIDAVKGFLSGTLKFPHIEVPHFHISGGEIPWGIGGKGTPPSVSVEWYAKAMKQPYILDGATIFGAMGNKYLGGGERGKEVIMGYDMFKNMGGDVNINMVVNAAPGMDTTELANIVSRKINKQVRELAHTW